MNNDKTPQNDTISGDHSNSPESVTHEQVSPLTVEQPVVSVVSTIPIPPVTTPTQVSVDTSQSTKLKGMLIKMMLAFLIAAASVAVFAILAGSMGEVAWKAITTIFSAIIHVGLLFAVISVADNKNPLLQRTNNIVINTSILITIMSFFTSIFSTWGVMTGSLQAKLYATYVVVLFLVLHAKTLMDVEVLYKKVRPYVYANYVFMVLVGFMVLGVIYTENSSQILSGFYGRLLAASAIIDVTLSMVVAVMNRLYLQKHPELVENRDRSGNTVGRIIVILLILLFVLWPLVSLMSAFI